MMPTLQAPRRISALASRVTEQHAVEQVARHLRDKQRQGELDDVPPITAAMISPLVRCNIRDKAQEIAQARGRFPR